jgi:uncharacterized protein
MEMKSTILKKLEETERERNVRIVYACESGSRAWGFPSPDSDYDVRFVYVHPTPWYLRISPAKDVIEMPAGPVLDVNGWDLRKAMVLLKKSNGPLLEWLTSPIVYREDPPAADALKALVSRAFLPGTSCRHYLSMAKGMNEKIRESNRAKPKTYLYALRSLLCCLWIVETRSPPPMLFEILKDRFLRGEIDDEVDRLLSVKAASNEADLIDRVPSIDEFIQNLIGTVPEQIPENPQSRNATIFDDTFIKILRLVNND